MVILRVTDHCYSHMSSWKNPATHNLPGRNPPVTLGGYPHSMTIKQVLIGVVLGSSIVGLTAHRLNKPVALKPNPPPVVASTKKVPILAFKKAPYKAPADHKTASAK